MAKLRYRRGQERDIVLEKANYDDSVFLDQYKRSLLLLNDYLSKPEDRSLKTIAYCGGRGDGKTSCMMSVLEIIGKSQDKDSEAYKLLEKSDCLKLAEVKCETMEVIDPSFFDENHNVLEIIIGHLYNSFRAYSEKMRDPDLTQKNNLQASFQEVKRSLFVLGKGEYDSINDLKELSVLSASITLHKQMETLISRYLKFIGKEVLVIPIDDIDLNMEYAYGMCEQIRKYLGVPHTIVMISLKIDQLEKIISYVYRCTIKREKYISNAETHEMAERYLNKLLPISSRVNMTAPYELGDIEIEIHDGKEMIIDELSLKMALTQLIFYRTRYLFYNPVWGVSPIVPNNMRDIFNMVGLLASMRSALDDEKNYKEILNENKRLFKSYFYSAWIGQFEKDLRVRLQKLVNFDFGTSFNREVIAILIEEFKLVKDYQGSDEDETDTLIGSGLTKEQKPVNKIVSSIISTDNFGYNISVGDVFYILSFLESETLEESKYALVFFLKSLYSIKLYEAYDEITEKQDMIYPSEQEDIKGLTTVDRRFDHVNVMQQLVGGSYFTYSPGELIPRGDTEGYDMRIIGSKEMYNLIKEVKDGFDEIIQLSSKENVTEKESVVIDAFNIKLNVMEFFILTIAAQVPQKHTKGSLLSSVSPVIGYMESARKNVDPFHFRKFSANTGFFLFDILAPFANILNPEFAYKRFPQVDQALYDKIFEYKGSVLSQMIEATGEFRKHIVKKGEGTETEKKECERWQKLHRLLSDAAIRNGEVLMAVKNNIAVGRREKHDGPLDTLRNFYDNIRNSEMKTLKRSPDGDVYEIQFRFLKPLQNVLKNSLADEKEKTTNKIAKDWYDNFFAVFNCNEPAARRAVVPQEGWREMDIAEVEKIVGKAATVRSIRKKILEFAGRKEGDPFGKILIPGRIGDKMTIDAVYECLRKAVDNDNLPVSVFLKMLRPINLSSLEGEKDKNKAPEKAEEFSSDAKEERDSDDKMESELSDDDNSDDTSGEENEETDDAEGVAAQ